MMDDGTIQWPYDEGPVRITATEEVLRPFYGTKAPSMNCFDAAYRVIIC